MNFLGSLLLICLLKLIIHMTFEHYADNIGQRTCALLKLLQSVFSQIPINLLFVFVLKSKLQFSGEKPLIDGDKAVAVDGEPIPFGVAVVAVDFRLLLPQDDVLSDVLPEDRPHFHAVFLQLFLKTVGFVQQCAVLLQSPREKLSLRQCSQEIGLKTRKGNHILFCLVNHADFIELFVWSSVVNVGEADVLRTGVDTADVGITVFVDGSEPIEGFGEENVRLDENASSFVKNMEGDESALYGFEVIFEVTLGLFPHSLLQFVDGFFYFEDSFVGEVRFEVASVDYGKLKQGQSGKVSHVFDAPTHENRLSFYVIDVSPDELWHKKLRYLFEFLLFLYRQRLFLQLQLLLLLLLFSFFLFFHFFFIVSILLLSLLLSYLLFLLILGLSFLLFLPFLLLLLILFLLRLLSLLLLCFLLSHSLLFPFCFLLQSFLFLFLLYLFLFLFCLFLAPLNLFCSPRLLFQSFLLLPLFYLFLKPNFQLLCFFLYLSLILIVRNWYCEFCLFFLMILDFLIIIQLRISCFL